MDDAVLMGNGRDISPIPGALWREQLSARAQELEAGLRSLSDEHRKVRNLVVSELPRVAQPMSPEFISRTLDLSLSRVNAILDELETGMTYLFRDGEGAVTWAYPVTVDVTAHHATFSTGEQIYAAWAIDAFAVPFVQGQLRAEPLSVAIRTECAHCSQPMNIEIDSEVNCRVQEERAEPLVFVPIVDFDKLADPSIIDAFWRKGAFFWSEEHARDHRENQGGVQGIYVTLEQSAYMTSLLQGALFGFPRRD